MGLFPTDANDGDEVTNTNGTTFKYVAADDKWIIVNTLTISDLIYNIDNWNANTDGATKNAIRDKIELLVALIAANTTVIEVEAVITAELVDGQSIDNRIDTLIAAKGFVDRGDAAGFDFSTANFTKDGAAHDLDLSGIVPTSTKGIIIAGTIKDNLVGSNALFYTKGNANTNNAVLTRTQEANAYIEYEGMIKVDSNRKITYVCTNGLDYVRLIVKGWWL